MKDKKINQIELDFLNESNKIESVYDAESLCEAAEAWIFLKNQNKLALSIIKEIHQRLMKSHLDGKELGKFRAIPVYIGGREAPNIYTIRPDLEKWLLDVNQRNKTEQQIKEYHVEYERIHPFIDGNGRTGRMFMNWERLRAGMKIDVITEEYKHEYYEWFRDGK